MIILHTNRLKVEIPHPGEGKNNTCRFDRAGFITSVMLDGTHECCTAEPDNPEDRGSGGAGLCSEIIFGTPSEEAEKGEQFAKFGVGLLMKPDKEPYNFIKKYEFEPFEIECIVTDTTAAFLTKPKLCNGYALTQKKTITLSDNILTMDYEAVNTGQKQLRLEEYCHNFLTIDHLPIGPDYILHFPTTSFKPGKRPYQSDATLIARENTFTYTGYNARSAIAFITADEISDRMPCFWELTNTKSALSIKEEVSFHPSKIHVWTIDHIISPEIFHGFDLAPGEEHCWSRKWIFQNTESL